jgi:hypothetical protein
MDEYEPLMGRCEGRDLSGIGNQEMHPPDLIVLFAYKCKNSGLIFVLKNKAFH